MLKFYFSSCIISLIIIIASCIISTSWLKASNRILKKTNTKKFVGIINMILISCIPILRVLSIIAIFFISICSDKTFKENFGTINKKEE